jgi:hypothetical protein
MEKKADRDKVLIIEHPVRKGCKLAESPKLLETTDTWDRFRQLLPVGKTETVMVKKEIIQGETIAIFPRDLGQLEFYSRMGEILKEVREALVEAFSLKSAMVDAERQMQEHQQ